VLPPELSIGDTSGAFTVRASVQNPTGRTLIVPLPWGERYSVVVGSAEEPLNAGPNRTEWGIPVDTIPAGGQYTLLRFTLREWLTAAGLSSRARTKSGFGMPGKKEKLGR
jgi:hypothetical protein